MFDLRTISALPGVRRLSATRYMDDRGWFSQSWTTDELVKIGFRPGFVQQNIAHSKMGVLRGMHRQNQAKLVTVVQGRIYDVVLEPETGIWAGFHLVEGDTLYVPPLYAHGYLALSESSTVQYLVDKPWNKDAEEQFGWSDYGIQWPLTITPILSYKDAKVLTGLQSEAITPA